MIIQDQGDYIDFLFDFIDNDEAEISCGTLEELAVQLKFGGSCDLMPLAPNGYPELVWDAIATVGAGMPLTAAQSTSLDYYVQNEHCYMTPTECEKYGKAAYGQLQ